MSRRLLAGLLSLIFIFGGCAHLPIMSVSPQDAQSVVDDFHRRLANKYEIVDSVEFKIGFFSFSSLGMTSIDLVNDHLAVAGVTPVGITLFSVVADKGKVTQAFVMPQFAKRGDVAKAVSGNIRDIYFDLTPGSFLSGSSRGDQLSVKTALENGLQHEYFFSLKDRVLGEKRLYKNGRLFWRIFYSNWTEDSAGHIHPGKIRLVHRAYHYQLIINTKEVRPL
ncbi:MAG: DUF3261 domain-containing protein [Candidatus Omnitrophica bacterium]|nr:DUF3261 domain-containing protein [Candidatus Omnitrophota bacterium]